MDDNQNKVSGAYGQAFPETTPPPSVLSETGQAAAPSLGPSDSSSSTLAPISVQPPSGNTNPLASSDPGDVITLSGQGKSAKKLKAGPVVATILGVVILMATIGVGVFLVQRQQLTTSQAWDCNTYVFEVSRQGVVTVRNGSTRNEPSQNADVFINNVKVATLNVPALSSGNAATLGNVTTPGNLGFTWRVDGTVDCDDNGSYSPISTPTPTQTPSPTPTRIPSTTPTLTLTPTPTGTPTPTPTTPATGGACSGVVAYDTNWNSLTSSDLSDLTPGDLVRFTVSGSASQGSFDKARFTVNGVNLGESANKKPGSSEFYVEYVVPDGVTNFTVSGQVHHSSLGWF